MRSYLSIIYRKRQSNRLSQEGGTFACRHCPFLTRRHDYLARHEKHHSANDPFQCYFCTFSSKSEQNLVGQHINRVHLEELKVTSLLTRTLSHLGLLLFTLNFQTKGDLDQPVNDKEATNVEPTGADQTENFPHPKEPVEQNGTPETAAEVEMVYISLPFFICFNV